MPSRDTKRVSANFLAVVTDPANLALNVVGGLISGFVFYQLPKLLRLDEQPRWAAAAIGAGAWLLLVVARVWFQHRYRNSQGDASNGATAPGSQSVHVGGNQLAPNINAPHGHVTIVNDVAAAALQDAVTSGTVDQIIDAFSRQQTVLKTFDPWWTLGVYLPPGQDGGVVSIQARHPEAYKHSPITIRFVSKATEEFPDPASLMRYVYASGRPVSLAAQNIELLVGTRPFMVMPTGTVTFALPDHEVTHSPIKLSIPHAAISYDYLHLSIREHAGVTYVDNHDQKDCSLRITATAERNPDGKTSKFSLAMELSQQGWRSAKQHVKYLTMTRSLAEGHPLVVTNLGSESTVVLHEGYGWESDNDLPAIVDQLSWWSKVCDLENYLHLAFEVPDRVTTADHDGVEHLWAVLVQKKAERELAPIGLDLKTNVESARQFLPTSGEDRWFAVGGEVEAESIDVMGTTIMLPARRIMIFPVRLENPEAITYATKTDAELLTLRFSSGDNVTVTEEPLEEAPSETNESA